MKTTKELLGARIKEVRKAKRLSQDQLSEKINIDPKHLSRIEVGKSYPSLDTLEKIAKALKVEIKNLFEFMHHAKSKDLPAGEYLIKVGKRRFLKIVPKLKTNTKS